MNKNSQIISIASRKGGTAKTTTAINISYELAERDYKTLILDLDSQRNTTETFKIENHSKYTVNDLFLTNIDFKDAISTTTIDNLDIIKSKKTLGDLDIKIADQTNRRTILKEKLNKNNINYDFIVIDTPPAFNFAVLNSIIIADMVVICTQPSAYDIDGVNELIHLINKIENKHDKAIIKRILTTQIDNRTTLSQDFINSIKETFKNQVFNTYISKNVAVKRSQFQNEPLSLYDKQATATKQYNKLTDEIINIFLNKM